MGGVGCQQQESKFTLLLMMKKWSAPPRKTEEGGGVQARELASWSVLAAKLWTPLLQSAPVCGSQ